MKKIIINDNNLKLNEIDEIKDKCRVIFIDDNNKILVVHYGEIYLLPGGKVDGNESIYDAAKREIKEETGMIINNEDLLLQYKLSFYQKNYLNRKHELVNRLINTYYFLSNIEYIIDNNNISLTEEEKKSNFELVLLSIEDIEEIIKINNNNPRNDFFNRELEILIEFIKKDYKVKHLKK